MTPDPARSRRAFLAAASAVLAGGAGCTGGVVVDVETVTDTPTRDEEGTGTASPTAGGALDLREANVTAVAFEGGNGQYRFDVTLHHDDDGEDGYANWWQVESLDGDVLGRRELRHPHGTREFTRSATIDVPSGTTCVVVRGHDQVHGYGGRAVLAALDTGATRAVRQGPEPRSFDAGDCP